MKPRGPGRDAAQPAAGPSGGLGWGYVSGIFLAVLAAYAPALRSGFIWDDDAHVTKAALQPWSGLAKIWGQLGATQQYYPVVHSAFWLQHRLWGDAPLGYHLANLCLQAAAACLFAATLRRLGVPGARFAGAIFALHPLCVESVAWISEEKNTLSLCFYLLAALAYLRFDGQRGRALSSGIGTTDSRTQGPTPYAVAADRIQGLTLYAGATGLFLCALLSKSVTATLPAALLVVAWWRRGALSWRRDVLPLLPWFVLAGAVGLVTAWVERHFIGAEGTAFALGLGERCLLAGRVIWFYLGKILWPADLVFIYPRWNVPAAAGHWLAYLLAAVAVTVFLWARRGRGRGPLAGWLFFVGSLFPALGFLNVYPFLFSYVADHFQYLASLGPIALVGAGAVLGLARLPPAGRRVGQGLAAALLIGLGALSWRQCLAYRDAATLYRVTLERNPDAWLAHLNLGNIALEEGRTAEAVEHYERAERLEPDYPSTHFNLAKVWLQLGRLPEAIAENEEDLRLVPTDAEARNNLGIALAESGRPAEAEVQFLEALRLRPDYARARANLEQLRRMSGAAAP